MKTVYVLISRDKIVQNFGEFFTTNCVQRYTEYLLSPYIQLGYISFCSFCEKAEPIDGKSTPNEMIDKIKDLYGIQQKHIAKTIHNASENTNMFEDIINTISGRFTPNSFFYNAISDSTYIKQDLLVKIEKAPEIYVLSVINTTK